MGGTNLEVIGSRIRCSHLRVCSYLRVCPYVRMSVCPYLVRQHPRLALPLLAQSVSVLLRSPLLLIRSYLGLHRRGLPPLRGGQLVVQRTLVTGREGGREGGRDERG